MAKKCGRLTAKDTQQAVDAYADLHGRKGRQLMWLSKSLPVDEATQLMRHASQDAFEQLCQALVDGNLEYFMLFINAELPINQDIQRHSGYKQVMKAWYEAINQPLFASVDQLDAIFAYLMPKDRTPPQILQRRLEHKGIYLTVRGGHTRGMPVNWKVTPQQNAAWAALFHNPMFPPTAAPGIYAVQ